MFTWRGVHQYINKTLSCLRPNNQAQTLRVLIFPETMCCTLVKTLYFFYKYPLEITRKGKGENVIQKVKSIADIGEHGKVDGGRREKNDSLVLTGIKMRYKSLRQGTLNYKIGASIFFYVIKFLQSAF